MSDWINTLHDSTLHTLTLEWKAARVRLQLTKRAIVVEGVTSLHAPHVDDWGPSESILEGDLVIDGDVTTVTVRMQSGDDIVIVGRAATMQFD